MAALTDALQHLEAGAWQQAHVIVQDDASPLGCWLHGVVHIMEGDLANAQYWYRRAGRTWADPLHIEAEIKALRSAVARSSC